MKKLFTILFFINIPIFLLAQSNIVYKYDYSGNRIERKQNVQINKLQKASNNTDNRDKTTQALILNLQNEVNIVYNTSTDAVEVNLPKSKVSASYNISVYLPDGSLVMPTKTKSGSSHTDLSNIPRGTYIVSVEHGGQKKTKKIVK